MPLLIGGIKLETCRIKWKSCIIKIPDIQNCTMSETRNYGFTSLFKEAFKKCFGFELTEPLSETESRHFGNKIFEETGLVIGAKSLKNYSFYILNKNESKHENPSVATLDTLARYVLEAPYTDELKRKENESHHPYWFQYQNSITDKKTREEETRSIDKKTVPSAKTAKWVICAIAAGSIIIAAVYFVLPKKYLHYTEDFNTVQEDSLKNSGWFLLSKDTAWWNRRNDLASHLTLFTLMGDSWADSTHSPGIKNLLLRKVTSDCFTTEIRLDNFVPLHRWQQAGIILMADTSFLGESLRLSIGYNDFFGGYDKPKEIIVQSIYSGKSSKSNPEEIIHFPLFSIEPGHESLVINNLRKSALKIEKNGTHFRFLYSTGPAENFAFKEILNKDITFYPKYIGIFALGGFVNNTSYIPAHFKYFKLIDSKCRE